MDKRIEPRPVSSVETKPGERGGKVRKCLGLLNRKEHWGLSGRGWMVLISLGAGLAGWILFGMHPFLAISQRTGADVLVVEGWVHEYAMRAAVEEFNTGKYKRVFTTGGPVTGLGRYVNDWQTSASVGADVLKRVGLPAEVLQMVPTREMERDRTYASAIALRNWFREQGLAVRAVNVLTEDAHARRTRLLFQKALGDQVVVGVISAPNPDYDAKRWWRYSEGVREVFSETVAYLYARFLFHPSEAV